MSNLIESRVVPARLAPTLTATLGPPRPLRYDHGAHPLEDLPAHVRAASAIRRVGRRLVIVQDDVNALAVLDPATGSTRPLLLPAGPGGTRVFDDARGNKKLKLDLEAGVVLPDGRLVALGSGSSPEREKIVTLPPGGDPLAQQMSGSELFAALRVHAQQRGVRLNIEGAVVHGPWLRLFQRGNGTRGMRAWNAIFDVALEQFTRWLDGRAACPPVRRVAEVDLGRVDGVPFGFTDAALTEDARIAFVACAEDTADATCDGRVLGCRFGWLAAGDGEATFTDVVDMSGQRTRLKLEGIEPRPGEHGVFDVVADMDHGDEPAQIAELRVGT